MLRSATVTPGDVTTLPRGRKSHGLGVGPRRARPPPTS
ncbi:hypothetical protein A7982_13817 [Minicystis rosea]|nr:hypothetical protein A7982_13817 [Minicystis rosea]